MTLEERVQAIEEKLNISYNMKSLQQILDKINFLESEIERVEDLITNQSNKTKRKELFIEKITYQNLLKALKWVTTGRADI